MGLRQGNDSNTGLECLRTLSLVYGDGGVGFRGVSDGGLGLDSFFYYILMENKLVST